MRDWDTVEFLLGRHQAEVVIFAQPADNNLGRRCPRTFVEEVATRRLWTGNGGLPRRQPGLTTRDVRAALDGDMPVRGVDRTTIEALRSIARHFRECFGDDQEL